METGAAVNPSARRWQRRRVRQVKDNANDDVLNSGRVGSIAKLAPGPNDFRLQLTVANSQPLRQTQGAQGQGYHEAQRQPELYDDYTDFDDFGAKARGDASPVATSVKKKLYDPAGQGVCLALGCEIAAFSSRHHANTGNGGRRLERLRESLDRLHLGRFLRTRPSRSPL